MASQMCDVARYVCVCDLRDHLRDAKCVYREGVGAVPRPRTAYRRTRLAHGRSAESERTAPRRQASPTVSRVALSVSQSAQKVEIFGKGNYESPCQIQKLSQC